jgi:hypothetical protein
LFEDQRICYCWQAQRQPAVPWIGNTYLLPIFVPPHKLKVFGLLVDSVVHRMDLATHLAGGTANAKLFAPHLANWKSSPKYGELYGSIHEVISDLLIAHCHEISFGCYVSSWAQDNRRRLFGYFDGHKFNNSKQETPDFADFIPFLPEILKGRCLMYTRKGYLGIAPEDTKVGDHITLLAHIPVLFLLRCKENYAEQSRTFELIGDVYLHGFEMLSFASVPPEPLIIQ